MNPAPPVTNIFIWLLPYGPMSGARFPNQRPARTTPVVTMKVVTSEYLIPENPGVTDTPIDPYTGTMTESTRPITARERGRRAQLPAARGEQGLPGQPGRQ
ncbi:hypothetical protein GCM10018954_055620 [Kutzneria kofuensis]